MTVARTVELEGHIIDSGTMGHCFGAVMDMGGEFEVEAFEVGRHTHEETYCRMRVLAETESDLRAILHELNQQGATVADPRDATLELRPKTGSCRSSSTGGLRRVPRGRTEIGDFRDDETLCVSNHLTPRVKPTTPNLSTLIHTFTTPKSVD